MNLVGELYLADVNNIKDLFILIGNFLGLRPWDIILMLVDISIILYCLQSHSISS